MVCHPDSEELVTMLNSCLYLCYQMSISKIRGALTITGGQMGKVEPDSEIEGFEALSTSSAAI